VLKCYEGVLQLHLLNYGEQKSVCKRDGQNNLKIYTISLLYLKNKTLGLKHFVRALIELIDG
jgi:hypothetical protein